MGNPTTRRTVFRRPASFLALPVCILTALALAGTAAATPDGADTSTAPWVASDKPDYAPGERVTLDGGAWQPGEAVRIEVEDDQGKTWQRDTTVSADAAGTISDSFDLPDWFVATYSVTATGSSGAVATASFTDGNVVVRARVGGSPLAVTFPAGSARSFNNTACSGTAATSNASAFTTNGTNSNYTNSSVAANNSQSASIAAPSPITIAGTTYLFSGWSADSPAELTVSTSGTTGCFRRGPSQSNNPAWNMTANYVAAPTSVATTTAAASATAMYGDDSVTLSATVTPASGPAPNVGTVTFTVRKGTATVGTATSGTVSSGSASATFPLSGVDADTYTVGAVYSGGTDFEPGGNSGQSPAPTLTVGPKALTGGFTASDKEYDGDADAEITGRSLDGTIAGDDVALTGGSASFDDKHARIDKPVTGFGFTLAGADSDNYTLGPVAGTTASISPLGITGGFTAADKEYDGSADAEITGRSLNGAIAGDDVELTGGSASFADKHAGTDKPVTGTGFALAGADADNYTLGSVADTIATITRRALSVGAQGVDKVYDGSTGATVTLDDDRVDGDALAFAYSASFAHKHVGDDKPVTVSGISIAGADAGNYELAGTTASTSADITPRPLEVSTTGVDKVYDGTTAATVVLATDEVGGDDLTAAYTTASFTDANAGAGKTVNVGGISISGEDAGNYDLASTTATATADIAPRPITVAADAKTKPFGALDPALTYAVSGGPLVSGDGFSGGLSRVAGEAVGDYDILQGTVSAGPNYAIAYLGATLTIGAWHALGFHQPIGIPNSLFIPAGNGGAPAATTTTVWNTAKGGSTIPLKFNVYESAGGVQKTSTADVQSFTSARFGTCTAGAANDPVEELASAGSTTLRYDTTEKQFVQNWKTPSVAAESCYRVALAIRDGSAIYAFVKLRK